MVKFVALDKLYSSMQKISIIIQAIHMAKSQNYSKSANDAKFKDQKTINSMSTLHDKSQEERFNKDV